MKIKEIENETIYFQKEKEYILDIDGHVIKIRKWWKENSECGFSSDTDYYITKGQDYIDKLSNSKKGTDEEKYDEIMNYIAELD